MSSGFERGSHGTGKGEEASLGNIGAEEQYLLMSLSDSGQGSQPPSRLCSGSAAETTSGRHAKRKLNRRFPIEDSDKLLLTRESAAVNREGSCRPKATREDGGRTVTGTAVGTGWCCVPDKCVSAS